MEERRKWKNIQTEEGRGKKQRGSKRKIDKGKICGKEKAGERKTMCTFLYILVAF